MCFEATMFRIDLIKILSPSRFFRNPPKKPLTVILPKALDFPSSAHHNKEIMEQRKKKKRPFIASNQRPIIIITSVHIFITRVRKRFFYHRSGSRDKVQHLLLAKTRRPLVIPPSRNDFKGG